VHPAISARMATPQSQCSRAPAATLEGSCKSDGFSPVRARAKVSMSYKTICVLIVFS